MLPISDAELALIQSDVAAAACDQICVIQRKISTKDAYGSNTEAFSRIETTIAGMAEPSAGELTNYDYLIGDKAAWHVRLPVGTNVEHQDHLLIGSQTLVVQVVLEPRSYHALFSVIATEIL
jgi:hypothetical protein